MSDKVVKSVRRVFKVLELFQTEQRPLTAVEIAKRLDYPHTSTHALLKSMQMLGYLNHDRENWSFFPSEALSSLTAWIAASVESEHGILGVMETLHADTGETINLSRKMGDYIKIVHGLESKFPVAVSVRQGVLMPINASHTGMVALACLPDEQVAEIVQQLQVRKYSGARLMSSEQAVAEVAEIRERKFSPGYDLYIGGVGAVCFPVKSSVNQQIFVVGVVGPSDRIRANEANIIRAAKKAIRAHSVSLAYDM